MQKRQWNRTKPYYSRCKVWMNIYKAQYMWYTSLMFVNVFPTPQMCRQNKTMYRFLCWIFTNDFTKRLNLVRTSLLESNLLCRRFSSSNKNILSQNPVKTIFKFWWTVIKHPMLTFSQTIERWMKSHSDLICTMSRSLGFEKWCSLKCVVMLWHRNVSWSCCAQLQLTSVLSADP